MILQSIVVSVVILGFVAIAVIVMRGLRLVDAIAERHLHQAYEGIEARDAPSPGDVEVVFQTYHGTFLGFQQTEHRCFAAPDEARLLLQRLERFNYRWAIVTYGALAIPFLTAWNAWRQRRFIERQERFSSQIDY